MSSTTHNTRTYQIYTIITSQNNPFYNLHHTNMQKKLIALYDWLKSYKHRTRQQEQLLTYIWLMMWYESIVSCKERLKDLIRIELMTKVGTWYRLKNNLSD